MQIDDWVVPRGKKLIVQVECLEQHGDITVVYTSDRSAYPKSDLMTLHEAYDLETNKVQ
jgi:hypothetical protein